MEAMERCVEVMHHFFNVDESADVTCSDDDQYDEEDENEDGDTTRWVRDRTAEYGLGFKSISFIPAWMINDETNNNR